MMNTHIDGIKRINREEALTTSSRVYDTLRDSIIDLQLKPGTAMSEKELADKLDVSRTPVREALIRLSKEGLVNIYPQKGTLVSKISIARAFEENFLRVSLECAVIEVFIKKDSKDAIKKLEKYIDGHKKATKNKDIRGTWQNDQQFHSTLFEATGNMLSEDIINNYSVNYYRIRRINVEFSEESNRLNIKQHEDILGFIKAKEVKKAQKAMIEHLTKFKNDLKELIVNYPELFSDADKYKDLISGRNR